MHIFAHWPTINQAIADTP